VRKLGIRFPSVLDEFGNSTERAYTGWPDRIYLIDDKGRVAYKSKPGPFGFLPDELSAALVRILATPQNRQSSTRQSSTLKDSRSEPPGLR
jgi:type I thyroxine 5'-deiodinase